MKNELSALLDGETDADGAHPILKTLARDRELRRTWNEYQLMGGALRSEPHLHVDLVARVMDEVRREPVVLAPTRRPAVSSRPLVALAASVSGVAVVGWLAFSPVMETSSPGIVAAAPIQPSAAIQAVSVARGMEEYLVAHQTHASNLQLQGGSRHIRTVSGTAPVAKK